MALQWNLKGIDNHEELCWRPRETEKNEDGSPVCYLRLTTERMIWATMFVDIGHLKTTKICREFYRRYVEASWASGWAVQLTLEDVLAHKGLSTNVHKTSEANWRKRLGFMLRDRGHLHMRTLDREAKMPKAGEVTANP